MPKNNSTSILMKKLIRQYVKPYFGKMGLAMIFMAVAAALTAALAQLMQPILDEVLNGKNVEAILPVGIAILSTFLIRGFATYFHVVIMARIGQAIVADIQKDLFTHFLKLDLTFFHENPSGQLISRVVNDVQIVRGAISDSLAGFGRSALTLIFLIGVMFYQNWQLSIAAFVIFPFAVGFVAYLGRRLRKISKNTQEEFGNLTDRLSQIFQGVRQVKAYNAEKFECARAGHLINRVRDLNVKATRIGSLSTPVNEVLVGIVASGIIAYGGYQVVDGAMTAGQLVSFLTAFIMAYEPMKKLAKLNNVIQRGLGAAERVFGMMNTKPAIRNQRGAKDFTSKKPKITFKDVEFQYAGDSENKALNRINFTAEPGKVTALVGPSGGGKTTIINLIPRFYDVTNGTVKIGTTDVRDFKLASLREHIALVSQDITIFDDTIAANIAYGRVDVTQKDIERAATQAAAHDFISAFPNGYDTMVGEDGAKLSGGQRQRISIARALLHNAPILLLDEATSALDNESEKAVQSALQALEKGRTTIVIAHRLSTVQEADQIIVLNDGGIVEQGTHKDLMNHKDGLYNNMYKAGLKA